MNVLNHSIPDRPALPPRPTPILWKEEHPSALTMPRTLSAEETHLWFTDLDQQVQDETVDFLLTLLDPQERARALRFRRPELTRRFVMAHGRLRQVLGSYLGQPPEAVRFCYGDRGKPGLESITPTAIGPCPDNEKSTETSQSPDGEARSEGEADGNPAARPPASTLQFNLSHSDRYALIAVSHYPVGVDLERVQPFPSASSLAKRFFSAKEFQALQLLNDSAETDRPPATQAQQGFQPDSALALSIGFLRHWVCKEAYVKATGRGLVDQLNQVSIEFSPQTHFDHLPTEVGQPPRTASGELPWKVMELTPSAATLAALVLPQDAPLRCQYWKI